MIPGYKNTFVGNFFERVMADMTGGNSRKDGSGDVFLKESRTSIEVKASGSQSAYDFRISPTQLEDYRQRICAGQSKSVWYALFWYTNRALRNPETGVRRTELSEYNDPKSINPFLAKRADWCLVVDITLIEAWHQMIPYSNKSLIGHLGRRTIDLKRRYLTDFLQNRTASGLKELGLDAEDYSFLSGGINRPISAEPFGTYQVNFPVYTVLQKVDAQKTRKRFSSRGIVLRPNHQ